MNNSAKLHESAPRGAATSWSDFKSSLKWNVDGLMPAIAQQHDTGEVLMMAWMNLESLEETMATGRVCYWSRSRGRFWRKGEESGQVQLLRELRLDCDVDTILLLVDQTGPACHTGRKHCFYNRVQENQVEVISEPLLDPRDMYQSKNI